MQMGHAKSNHIRQSNELLRLRPPPLLDSGKKVIVLWSPKSACTASYVWFSHLAGFSDELAKHHAIPHRHRLEVYMKSDRYREAIECDTRAFHVVRILRDPYSRAASIFRHALVTRFADRAAARAGLDFAKGVSFREFLDFLAAQRMHKADVHMRPQVHRFERHRKPDTVINISKDDMFQALNALERHMGWPVTDFQAIDWLHKLESSRRANCKPFAGENGDEIPIVRGQRARTTRFPPYGQLLTPRTRRQIETIYHDDFEAYRDYL
jgi:hypothetical protein